MRDFVWGVTKKIWIPIAIMFICLVGSPKIRSYFELLWTNLIWKIIVFFINLIVKVFMWFFTPQGLPILFLILLIFFINRSNKK